jgi:YidC/Oxa1 family membrane protein insertase
VDKRLPLALFLSFLVLFVWVTYFAPKRTPPPTTPQGADAASLQEPAEQDAGNAPQAGGAPSAVAQSPAIGPVVGDSEERTLELQIGEPGKVGSYFARFTNKGARLLELRLANFYDKSKLPEAERAEREHWVRLLESVPTPQGPSGSLELRSWTSSKAYERGPIEDALWTMRELAQGEGPNGRPGVVFELAQGSGLRLVKRVTFEPETYRIHVELELENTGTEGADRSLAFFFTPGEVLPQESADKYYQEPQAVFAGQSTESYRRGEKPQFGHVARNERATDRRGQFQVPAEVVRFAGVHIKYFALLMRAADDAALGTLRGAEWRRLRDEQWALEHPDKADRAWRFMATDVLLELRMPAPGETRSWEYVVFAGPKDRELLLHEDQANAVLIDKDLGTFDGIARALLAVLGLFERLTGNWGVAIILLTLSVRLLLFPINRRSQTSMARYAAKMKRLQPQIDELKKRFDKEPKKMQQAQAELMQKEGAFPPLGGCLPIFVQLPIFFGLYQALRTSFDLRQAPFFGWMNDLSQPDRLLEINLHAPVFGTIQYLNILPPLMVVLWVLQQMTMPKPADEQAARMQRMMLFMPVVMGVFLYDYAAGLSLYMITQSSLGIFEQHVIKRLWPVDDKEPVKKKRTGFLARLMERAQDAQRQAEARKRRNSGGGASRRQR